MPRPLPLLRVSSRGRRNPIRTTFCSRAPTMIGPVRRLPARRHIAEAERNVAHQREIISQKQRDGHETSMSKELLGLLEECRR